MYISLTNSAADNKGLPICFKKDSILSVRRGLIKREGEEVSEVVTLIYIPPYGTWEVSETYEEVLELMNKTPTCKKIK